MSLDAAPAPENDRVSPARFSEYFDERVETLSRDSIMHLQECLLDRVIHRAYETVPLVRHTWSKAGVRPADVRTLKDFTARAPFISKDAVRAYRDTHSDPFGGMNGVLPVELKGVTFTSGTTGDPTPVLRGSRSMTEICTVRDAWMMGARPGDYVTLIRPTFRVGHIGTGFLEAGFIPVLFRHHPAIMADLVKAIGRFAPACHLFLSNPLLIAMEAFFEQTNVNPVLLFRNCKGATVGGEPLSPRLAQLVQGWGLELFNVGGLGESITMVDCRAHDGMHAWEDHVIIECLDPQGDQSVPDGAVGELVVTVLSDPCLPMIRYRTDDLVTVKRGRCPCGRTHARIKIIGRKSDQLIVAGKAVLPRDLQLIIEAHRPTRAGLYQVVKYGGQMEMLRVRIGYEQNAYKGTLNALGDQLRDSLADALSIPVQVEMTPNEELLKLGPPHKIPRVASQ